MHRARLQWAVAIALAGAAVMPAVLAEEEPQKTLPTLLIKGEVVSTDTNDPTAPLLTVRDRYGFDTPIYLAAETSIMQGAQAIGPEQVSTGAVVEVEYNFDINTAKRHAVSVKVQEAAASPGSPTPAAEATPEASEASEEEAEPAQAQEGVDSGSAEAEPAADQEATESANVTE